MNNLHVNNLNVNDLNINDFNTDSFMQIKNTFWYSNYYGRQIVIDSRSGYINATKLCIQENKSYGNWIQTKKMKEILKNFTSGNQYGSHYQIKGNNSDILTKKYTGTFIHPDLLPHLIFWLDKNKKGDVIFIYILTNNHLEQQNIYKIGTTSKSIDSILKFINKTRHSSEHCYVKSLYSCHNKKSLDVIFRYKLQKYRENSKYFRCHIDIIENSFNKQHLEKLY